MFYYKIVKSITNIHDTNPLQIKGRVQVYTDEGKTQLLTEIPFSDLDLNLTVAECPTESAEAFNAHIEQKALEKINQPEIQEKISQVKLMADLGLL